MSEQRIDPATIPGWGVDADPENDPSYPMRHVEDQTRGDTWQHPAAQDVGVEILQSVEYSHSPAVTGTSTPPAWASGSLRRYAFHRSESDWWHWLLLMAADRVNVVEGVLEDLSRGKVPNIPGEMGARAAWRHNRAGVLTKAGVLLAAGAVVAGVLRTRAQKPLIKNKLRAEAKPAAE